MKNTLLVIIALISVSYSNVLGNDNSIIADTPRNYRGINVQDFTIKGNGEECWFLYDLDSSKISRSDCLSITNSKGIEIFCTAKKKMCKTKQELYAFIERNVPTKKESLLFETSVSTNNFQNNLKAYNISNAEAKQWKNAGFSNPSAIEKWKKSGGCSLTEIEQWGKVGIRMYDILHWKDLGINSPADAKEWLDMNFNTDLVLRLQEDGINSPEEAKQWKDAVKDIFEVYLWKKVGINSPEEAKQWKDAKFNADDTIGWKNVGVNSPSEAKQWKDIKIQYTTVSKLKKAGISSPAEVKIWNDAGFNADNTINWKKEGVNSPNEAKQWRDVGIAFYSINPLKKVGVNSPNEILTWSRIGIPPKEVFRWKDAGITLREAEKMKKLGASYQILGYLKKEGIVTADEYKIFDSSEKKVKKMCSASLTRYGINCPVDTFRKAIDKGCDKVEVLKTGLLRGKYIPFSESDPYENDNKCYIFAADLSQRLDKNHGLFSSDNGTSYLEIPVGRYSVGTTYIGVVRGEGDFKYETIYGDTRIISKGKVLSITN